MANSVKRTFRFEPVRYLIKVSGKLSGDWSDLLSGMEITTENDDQETQVTSLVGIVNDQAALRGILSKIWDLNLTVITVKRIG